MEKRDLFLELLDWIDQRKELHNPAQMGSLLMGMGMRICYDLSPSIEEANAIIQCTLKTTWHDHLRDKGV